MRCVCQKRKNRTCITYSGVVKNKTNIRSSSSSSSWSLLLRYTHIIMYTYVYRVLHIVIFVLISHLFTSYNVPV